MVAYVTAPSQSMHDSIYVTLHLLQLIIRWPLFGVLYVLTDFLHHERHNSISILCWCMLQTAARVWDALLNEGPKVLFRIALAVLKTNESTLLQQDNVGLLLREVRQAVTHLHDRDKLMKASLPALSNLILWRNTYSYPAL
jgi:hypothetical protein